MVQRGTDIRHLLARRLQRWKEHCFEDLVNETERCAWQLPRSRFKDEKDWCVKMFTHLMFRDQVRSAVRFITDRVHCGGVLSLDASTSIPVHSVLDILHEKHPEPGVFDESAFMPSLLCLTWISLLTTWNMWLTNFRDLQGLVDLLHCSCMDTFSAMVHPVHVYVMLLLCWPVIWQVELWIGRVYML